jgi:hypothetical protein
VSRLEARKDRLQLATVSMGTAARQLNTEPVIGRSRTKTIPEDID